MNEQMRFKRNPAIHCWIKHIKESFYNENERAFYSIFGKVKRIRLIATIIEKSEELIGNDEFGFDNDNEDNVRLLFDLDDGTGLIKAFVENREPENFKDYDKGDIVDVVGLINKRSDLIVLRTEIIKKVVEPNYILLRNAEILNRIKSGDIQKIPNLSDFSKTSENIVKEIEVNNLFEEDIDSDELKERIFSVIKVHSSTGTGIDFEELSKELEIPDIELRTYLNDLLLESRIYESDHDKYESY